MNQPQPSTSTEKVTALAKGYGDLCAITFNDRLSTRGRVAGHLKNS